jgi:hypothetical protein
MKILLVGVFFMVYIAFGLATFFVVKSQPERDFFTARLLEEFVGNFRIEAKTTLPHAIYFRVGEFAMISARGSGTTDLDIYVIDPDCEVIIADEDGWDNSQVGIYAFKEGVYTVKVANNGAISNEYEFKIERLISN